MSEPLTDKEVFEEMLTSAGCSYTIDEKWNAVGVKPSTGGAAMFFLFDNNGNMYSLPEDKHKEWIADHTRVVEVEVPAENVVPHLAIEKDKDGNHYVYEPDAEPGRWKRQKRREEQQHREFLRENKRRKELRESKK